MADGYAKKTRPGPVGYYDSIIEIEPVSYNELTGSGYFTNRLILLFGHEADDREYGKS